MRGGRLAALVGAVLSLAAAGDPAERLADPGAEARARVLFRETRCLVCQGESIDDSEADLAADLRRIIRMRVAAGQSDSQVRRFLVGRYGEFVLLRPPLSPANVLLWTGPFLVLLAGGALLFVRRRQGAEAGALSSDEEARIRSLEAGEEG